LAGVLRPRVPPTRRINRGSGHSYYLDGERAPGVTTALGEGFPKPALVGWAANTTRDYAVDHWDELAKLGPAERVKRLGRARFEDRDPAGDAGRKVHTLAERLAAGDEVEVPESLVGHVDSYLRFVDEWSPVESLVEAVVINRRFVYMGTLDLVTELADGRLWLLDLKTARSGVFAENALQLAAYRNAESYLVGSSLDELPMPAVDRCGVVWLRADGYDLVPVEAGAEEFRIFLYALGIARWRDVENVVGEAIAAPKERNGSDAE
jgi:hypothetical protein